MAAVATMENGRNTGALRRPRQEPRGDGSPTNDSGDGRRVRIGKSGRHCPAGRPTTMALALALLSLFAIDGAAWTNHPGRPRRAGTAAPHSTALQYKNGTEKDDIFPRSKRTKLRPSKKKYKARKSTARSYQLHKKGVPATEDELANHVQSVFSDLKEFGDEEDEEDDEEGPCIVSEAGEEGSDFDASRARQLENVKVLERHSALVLNADYQPLRMLPLSIWSWQDTVKAVLSGKAVVVDIYPGVYVRAVNLDMPVPSVIALREYAPTGKAKPAFTRRNVFLRDGYRCQYCSELFRTSDLSLDHVEPRSLGGKLTWDNTVTCCKKCNGRKGCLRPTELHHVGMELKTVPRCPSLFELAAEATKFVPRRVHPTWAPYLGISAEEVAEDAAATKEGGAERKKKNSHHLQ